MRTIKIQLPYISWFFILLDLVLLSLQFTYTYLRPGQRGHWRSSLILLLLMAYNVITGNLFELWMHIAVNVVILTLVVLLWFKRLPSSATKQLRDLPETAFQLVEITEAMATNFLENCRVHQFSLRETDVALLLAKGMTNNEIADTLHISLSTVETHINRCYKKAGVKGRVAMINKFNQKPVN